MRSAPPLSDNVNRNIEGEGTFGTQIVVVDPEPAIAIRHGGVGALRWFVAIVHQERQCRSIASGWTAPLPLRVEVNSAA